MRPSELLSASTDSAPARIRRRALWKIGGGAVVAALAGLGFHVANAHLGSLHALSRFLVIAAGILCVPLLVGLLELISGMSLLEVARRWDALAGWQRGVIGLLVVIVVFALLGVGIVSYVRIAVP